MRPLIARTGSGATEWKPAVVLVVGVEEVRPRAPALVAGAGRLGGLWRRTWKKVDLFERDVEELLVAGGVVLGRTRTGGAEDVGRPATHQALIPPPDDCRGAVDQVRCRHGSCRRPCAGRTRAASASLRCRDAPVGARDHVVQRAPLFLQVDLGRVDRVERALVQSAAEPGSVANTPRLDSSEPVDAERTTAPP